MDIFQTATRRAAPWKTFMTNRNDEAALPEPANPLANAAPPRIDRLIHFGRHALSAALQSWRRRWDKKTRLQGLGNALGQAQRRGESLRPAGAPAAWMTAMGWDGQDLRPTEVAAWALQWKADQDQRRAARLSP